MEHYLRDSHTLGLYLEEITSQTRDVRTKKSSRFFLVREISGKGKIYLLGVFLLLFWPLIHQNVRLRSDNLLTMGLDQRKAKEFSHHLESKTLGGGYSVPLYFRREKTSFHPTYGTNCCF